MKTAGLGLDRVVCVCVCVSGRSVDSWNPPLPTSIPVVPRPPSLAGRLGDLGNPGGLDWDWRHGQVHVWSHPSWYVSVHSPYAHVPTYLTPSPALTRFFLVAGLAYPCRPHLSRTRHHPTPPPRPAATTDNGRGWPTQLATPSACTTAQRPSALTWPPWVRVCWPLHGRSRSSRTLCSAS